MHTDDPHTLGALRRAMAALASLPDDTPVILAKDSEGNGYSPFAGTSEGMYFAESSYAGSRYLTDDELAEEMAQPGSGWSEDDGAPEGSVLAVFLTPIN
ncbi:hypothetical protein B4N89_27675 [Embleya scabrispora]|uniref:Uncharacterized protein n=1 Tax=Embleya scabrispora TaxID=159449 RepID=A0A1T3P5I8_9ACTN|nr:hypothetical protein [Embleya scabrispora]OPC84205.1 hypothetical protein B4N89_27675 [Embleya scabrispora]